MTRLLFRYVLKNKKTGYFGKIPNLAVVPPSLTPLIFYATALEGASGILRKGRPARLSPSGVTPGHGWGTLALYMTPAPPYEICGSGGK